MKKRLFLLFVVFVLLFTSAAFAQSEPEPADRRVFDYAGLLAADDAEALQASIIDFQENTGYDFAIMVTDVDHGYSDYQDLVNNFVVSKSLGLGMNRTVIVCYLDLYGDGYYFTYFVSVFGDLRHLMQDEDIQYLIDKGLEYFNSGDFTGGLTWTINMLSEALLNIGIMNQSKRVYDFDQFLTEEQTVALETAIADFRALSGMDFLYLSTYEEMEGNSNGEYMSEFYYRHGFGEGENRSGAMIYLDLDPDTRYFDYYIRNFGDMDASVSQEALNGILDSCIPLMDEGKISEAVLHVIDAYSAYFR